MALFYLTDPSWVLMIARKRRFSGRDRMQAGFTEGSRGQEVTPPMKSMSYLPARLSLLNGPGATVGPRDLPEAGDPSSRVEASEVPAPDLTFWVDNLTARYLGAIEARARAGEIVNVLLVGPTGTGKSSLPKEFAANFKRPFFAMHCQLISEPEDWWGAKEVSPDRGTYVQKTALVEAMETPNCIVLLDEANRTPPENLNALFGCLDHRRSAWVPLLSRTVRVAPGVVFFVTLNEGTHYFGTNPVDRALKDRISNAIRMGYPPREVEEALLTKRTGISQRAARQLVDLAATVRQNPKLEVAVSTRQLLECAAFIKVGLPLEDAVQFSVVNGVAEESERKALLQALQMAGGEVSRSASAREWEDEE